jgi:hypothetical protein
MKYHFHSDLTCGKRSIRLSIRCSERFPAIDGGKLGMFFGMVVMAKGFPIHSRRIDLDRLVLHFRFSSSIQGPVDR